MKQTSGKSFTDTDVTSGKTYQYGCAAFGPSVGQIIMKLFFGGIGHRSAGKSVRCKNTKAQQYICDTWMEQNIRFQRIPGL